MIDIDIEISQQDIKSIRHRLRQFEDKTPNVLSRAINRTVASIKTEMKRDAAKRYSIAQKDVAATLNERKASSKELYGYVKSTGAVIPLSKFRVTPQRTVSYDSGEPNPSHYSAAVLKRGALKALKHSPKAFVAVMPNGHGGVYERTGKKSRVNPQKEVIAQRFGPSVPHMIKNKVVIDSIQNKAESTLQKRIDAEINYILSRG